MPPKPHRFQVGVLQNTWVLSLVIHGSIFGALLLFIFLRPDPLLQQAQFEILERPHVVSQPKGVSHSQPKPLQTKTAKPVFGASRKTASHTQDSPEIAAGNTTTPTQNHGPVDDANALPAAADEFMISQMPVLSEEVRIPYPPEAKKAGIEGAVVMDILIDSTGVVREARLVDGPSPELIEAALKAVRLFKFRPALIQDKAVTARIRYAYRFVLEK